MNNIERLTEMTEELALLSEGIDQMDPTQLKALSTELVEFQESLSKFCSTVAASLECNSSLDKDQTQELVVALEEGTKRVNNKLSKLGV